MKWEDTSDNEEGFRIYRITAKDTKKIAEVGPNVTSYVDRDGVSGACYAVSAFNSAGESSPSNTACLVDKRSWHGHVVVRTLLFTIRFVDFSFLRN